MIRQAALYLATADDAPAALLQVAGRPLAYRAIVTAIRAGARAVAVPAVLRAPEVEAAVAASPSARAGVVWLDAGAHLPSEPTLMMPAAAVVPVRALRALLRAGPGTVLAASRATAPVVVTDAAVVRTLADDVARGAPLGNALDHALKTGEPSVVDAGWFARVTDTRTAAEAERRLYGELGSPVDTALDIAVHRRLSRAVTRVAMAWRLTPNQISVASCLVGLVAAWCFWHATAASAVAGLAIYVVAVVLDHADGEVARLALTESALGAWLDIVVDTVVHTLLVIAMGMTAQRVAGSGAALGFVAAAGVVASAVLFKLWPPVQNASGGAGWLDRLSSRDGFYAMLVLFIAALVLRPSALAPLMILVAVGSHAYWLARVTSLAARR